MQPYHQDEGWTLVHRRRGRNRYISHQLGYNQHNQPPHPAHPARLSYAAVLQRDRRDPWSHHKQPDIHRYDDRAGYARRRSPAPQQRSNTHRERSQTHPGRQSHRSAGQRPAPDPRQSQQRSRRVTAAPPADGSPHQRARRAADQAPRGHNWVDTQDPNFTCKVRHMFKIIKAQHHKCNIDTRATPPFIKRIADHLKAAIKPAFYKDSPFIDCYADTVQTWEDSVVANLKEHYTDFMDGEMGALEALPVYDWRGPFQIAEAWAHRNLGRRLSEKAIQEAKTFIEGCMSLLTQPEHIPQPPPAAATAPAPPSSPAGTSGLPATLPVAMTTPQSRVEIPAPAGRAPVRATAISTDPEPVKGRNITIKKDYLPHSGLAAPLDSPVCSSPLPLLSPLPPREPRRQAFPVSPPLASLVSPGPQQSPGTPTGRRSTHQPGVTHNPCVQHENLLLQPLLATPLSSGVLSPALSPILERSTTHTESGPLSPPVQTDEEDTLPEEEVFHHKTPVSVPSPVCRRVTRQSSVSCQTPAPHSRAR